MLTTIVLLTFAAVVAYAAYAWMLNRREGWALGRNMGVRYSGHVALNRRRLSAGGAGVTPDTARSWQHEAPGPTALDLLYEQMEEQRQREVRLRREEERERERGY